MVGVFLEVAGVHLRDAHFYRIACCPRPRDSHVVMQSCGQISPKWKLFCTVFYLYCVLLITVFSRQSIDTCWQASTKLFQNSWLVTILVGHFNITWQYYDDSCCVQIEREREREIEREIERETVQANRFNRFKHNLYWDLYVPVMCYFGFEPYTHPHPPTLTPTLTFYFM